jgi:hypothetical protein
MFTSENKERGKSLSSPISSQRPLRERALSLLLTNTPSLALKILAHVHEVRIGGKEFFRRFLRPMEG